jgi:hypothetical protein
MTLYNSKKLSSIADLCTNLYALALDKVPPTMQRILAHVIIFSFN